MRAIGQVRSCFLYLLKYARFGTGSNTSPPGQLLTSMHHYSHMKAGPELDLERALVPSLIDMFGCHKEQTWLGGSLPIGSGAPDIVLAQWRPEILSFSDYNLDTAKLLGYLRGVSHARSDTIADRLRKSSRLVSKRLEALEDDCIVQRAQSSYRLAAPWRSVLSDVITIEVKVRDWRRAVSQAARNSILAHKSLVAMPSRIAERVRLDPVVQSLGLGVISIDQDGVELVKRPRRKQPRAWPYYYQVANVVASELAGDPDALRRIH